MPFFRPQPLRRQILVVTTTLLVLLIAAIVWSASRTRAERRSDVQQEAATVARLAAAYLDQYFDGIDAMALGLARHPAITSLNQVESASLLADLMKEQPLLLNAVVRDRELRLVAAGLPALVLKLAAAPPRYLADVVKTGKPAVNGFNVGPLTGKPNIGQAYPLRGRDGSVVGVLAFGLNLLELQRVFDDLSLPDDAVVTVFDHDGRVLVRSRDGVRYLGMTVKRPETERPNTASLVFDIDGIERFVATVPSQRGLWSVSVGIPRSVVLARLAPLWWRNLVISFSVVGTVLLLALWLSHHVSAGLNRLRLVAQRIGHGDLSPPERVAMPILEIADLQDAFVRMAANLRDAKSALDLQVAQERSTHEAMLLLQRQVVRQERLAAVGLLISGVAHELNNPLQAILGTAELVERHPGVNSALHDEIALLKTQSSRAREIIRNLARFGSQQSGPPSLVDLRTVIHEVLQLRGHQLAECGIELDVEANVSTSVYANMTELEQVVLNFVINAEQAIQESGRGHGRIRIRVSDVDEHVRLEVQDDGPGVAPEHESKLFQPFFTTKPVGKGTGLGLSVSYGIIDSYGGTIGCHANEWHGATFFFDLPAADPQPVSTVERRCTAGV